MQRLKRLLSNGAQQTKWRIQHQRHLLRRINKTRRITHVDGTRTVPIATAHTHHRKSAKQNKKRQAAQTVPPGRQSPRLWLQSAVQNNHQANQHKPKHQSIPIIYQKLEPQTPHILLIGKNIENTKSRDRKSTRLNSSHVRISYAVFCLKKK